MLDKELDELLYNLCSELLDKLFDELLYELFSQELFYNQLMLYMN